MQIEGSSNPAGIPGLSRQPERPDTPEEAARQFEQVLVRQMVSTMTREIFDQSLTGEDGPAWMSSYSDIQSDILSSELARQLSESGKLGIAEMLLRQWSRQDSAEDATSKPQSKEVHP